MKWININELRQQKIPFSKIDNEYIRSCVTSSLKMVDKLFYI